MDICPCIGQACKGKSRQQLWKNQKVYPVTGMASETFCRTFACEPSSKGSAFKLPLTGENELDDEDGSPTYGNFSLLTILSL